VICGGQTRKGGSCQRPAGWGTDHAGAGRCKLHAGNSPSGRKAAQRELAVRAVTAYGLPREIDPHQALLDELYRTQGTVDFLAEVVAGLERGEMHGPVGGGQNGFPSEEPSVWIRMLGEERKHLVNVAKACIAAGVEERRLALVEDQARAVVQAVSGALAELGIGITPQIRAVVGRHLALASGVVEGEVLEER
jgi:hypothetical protein